MRSAGRSAYRPFFLEGLISLTALKTVDHVIFPRVTENY